MTETCVRDPRGLLSLTRMVHECWFDLAGVRFDPGNDTLIIPYRGEAGTCKPQGWGRLFAGLVSHSRGKGPERLLKIRGVDSYSIRDTEKIRYYDFNEIKYDPSGKTVTITTGVPVGITVNVRGLDISVEETGNTVEYGPAGAGTML